MQVTGYYHTPHNNPTESGLFLSCSSPPTKPLLPHIGAGTGANNSARFEGRLYTTCKCDPGPLSRQRAPPRGPRLLLGRDKHKRQTCQPIRVPASAVSTHHTHIHQPQKETGSSIKLWQPLKAICTVLHNHHQQTDRPNITPRSHPERCTESVAKHSTRCCMRPARAALRPGYG
jgi:hypothetical protein